MSATDPTAAAASAAKRRDRPSRVLLTNDDGVDSSLLVPFIEAMYAEAGGRHNLSLQVLVPDAERSWSSKVMSRFDDVEMRVTSRDGHGVHTLSGTPADCAAVGCYHMNFGGEEEDDDDDEEEEEGVDLSSSSSSSSSRRPDLVVSGINLGANFGTAFFLSSGTVGAALEGAIAGVPGVALSLILGDEARESMKNGKPPADAAGAAAASARVVAAALRAVRGGEWPEDVDVLNVNLPAGVVRDTPAVVTRVGRSRYLECFKRVDKDDNAPTAGDAVTPAPAPAPAAAAIEKEAEAEAGAGGGVFVATFKHAPSGMSWEDVDEGSDTWAVKSGRISVSAVTLEGVCSATRPRAAAAAAVAGEGASSTPRALGDVSLSWLGCCDGGDGETGEGEGGAAAEAVAAM